ncbi:hypothetical protein [Streptomyces zagrosensis]|uniref:Uncharacterized protein n=1 Tax=Streptomyces zagrosensis TaxID=1042984 RepID=A0A7W9V121_9ACTN|nr:hypothetical protein [Streptomyces zagrosensis]MBB5937334.1 hypothetical protein [Streptomyces zagrosensis]
MTAYSDRWPPAPEPADAQVEQRLGSEDQLACDVPLVEAADPVRAVARSRSAHRILTGQHTVRLGDGTALRFFLAGAAPLAPACGWQPVTDVDFQLAYEAALFEAKGLADGVLRSNANRVQLTLDTLAGPGGFYWSDGADAAGIMTTNGHTPEACGFDLTEIRRSSGGAG